MKKLICSLFLWSTAALAQSSLTIPSQTFTTPVTINGTTIQVTITVPSQTVTLPASGASALPSGMTYSATTGLTVVGPITSTGVVSATEVGITSGSPLPTCASLLYLWQADSTGILHPACYTAPTFTVPPLTVSQSTSPINTFTFTP